MSLSHTNSENMFQTVALLTTSTPETPHIFKKKTLELLFFRSVLTKTINNIFIQVLQLSVCIQYVPNKNQMQKSSMIPTV